MLTIEGSGDRGIISDKRGNAQFSRSCHRDRKLSLKPPKKKKYIITIEINSNLPAWNSVQPCTSGNEGTILLNPKKKKKQMSPCQLHSGVSSSLGYGYSDKSASYRGDLSAFGDKRKTKTKTLS